MFWLGQVYLKVKDFAQATEYFRKIIKMHPNSSLLFSAKMQLGWIFIQDGRYEEAKSLFDTLTKSDDIVIQEEAMFKKGELQFQTKDYSGVLDTFKIYTEVFFDSDRLADAYFYMGQASFYLDDLEKSIDYYSKALEKSDDDLVKAASLQGIGWSYLNENKIEEAKDTFSKIDKFISKDFNRESLFLGKATLHYRLNKLEEAIVYYDKLIRMYPKSDMLIQALFGKAECLSGLLRFDEAISIYREVVDRGTKEESDETKDLIDKAYYNLGWTYFRMEDFKSAIPELKKATSLSSNIELKLSALYHIGEAYQNIQEFDKAIEVYYRILQDYPDNSYNDYVLYQLGLTQLKSDQINSAILSFKNFNKNFIQSDFLDEINYYLGYAYFKNNELGITCQQLEKFLEVFPGSIYRDKATYLLGVSFYNREMFKEAIDNFEKILKEFWQNKDLTEKAEYEIASALYQIGDEKLAIKRYRQFINAHPKSEITPNIIFWLGQYYHGNLQYELARRNFEMLVRMYPKHDLAQEAKYEIGLTFLSEGRYSNSLQTFERLLDTCNQQELKAKTMLAIGDLLSEEGRQERAIEIYNELTQLISSNNIDSKVPLEAEDKSELNIKRIEYSEEMTEVQIKSIFEDKIKQKKSRGSLGSQFVKLAYIRLGNLYKEKSRFPESIYAYREALKFPLDETNAQTQFKIAESLEEENDLDDALKIYSNISYNYEQDKFWIVKGLLRSSRIYEDRGDWQKAINIYEKILNYDVPEAKYAKEKIELIKKQVK